MGKHVTLEIGRRRRPFTTLRTFVRLRGKNGDRRYGEGQRQKEAEDLLLPLLLQ